MSQLPLMISTYRDLVTDEMTILATLGETHLVLTVDQAAQLSIGLAQAIHGAKKQSKANGMPLEREVTS